METTKQGFKVHQVKARKFNNIGSALQPLDKEIYLSLL